MEVCRNCVHTIATVRLWPDAQQPNFADSNIRTVVRWRLWVLIPSHGSVPHDHHQHGMRYRQSAGISQRRLANCAGPGTRLKSGFVAREELEVPDVFRRASMPREQAQAAETARPKVTCSSPAWSKATGSCGPAPLPLTARYARVRARPSPVAMPDRKLVMPSFRIEMRDRSPQSRPAGRPAAGLRGNATPGSWTAGSRRSGAGRDAGGDGQDGGDPNGRRASTPASSSGRWRSPTER